MRAVAEALLDIGAVKITPDQPFSLASGRLSPVYIDDRLVMSHPEEREMISKEFARRLRRNVGLVNFDSLVGAPTAGIHHAANAASLLRLPLHILESVPEDRTQFQLHTKLKPGERVVVIEDHVTSGGSVADVVKFLRNRGAVADWCLSITALDRIKARKFFSSLGVQFQSLSELREILKVARGRGLSEREYVEARKWMRDPTGWAEKFLALQSA